MSHKNAKRLRKEGQDRRQVNARRDTVNLANPKCPVNLIDGQTHLAYQLVRRQIDDVLIGEDGLLRILPARVYADLPRPFLQIWAGEMGYHLFPTEELVEWIRGEIGGQTAIEICAGAGILGRALGVPCIDWDVCSRFPEVRLLYDMNRQGIPMIGPHCEKIEALEAVAKYQPEVVFGGYITQRSLPGDPTSMAGSFAGVDERELIRHVRKYIVVGSLGTHGKKKIWRDRTRDLSPDWIVTRSANPEDQIIAVWENPSPVPVGDLAPAKNAAQVLDLYSQARVSRGEGTAQPLMRQLR